MSRNGHLVLRLVALAVIVIAAVIPRAETSQRDASPAQVAVDAPIAAAR